MKARIAILILVAICTTFAAQTGPAQQQAWKYLLQARAGDTEAAGKAVTLLEQATAATPNDPTLWSLLGRSYFLRLAALSSTATKPEHLLSTVQQALDAFDRALERNPNDTAALSGHGMAQTILAGFQRSQERFMKGVQEMNHAVELDPKANAPRLARGFTMVNFPLPIRSTPSVIEDLTALIQNGAYNKRAVDTLHILLGDVYAEAGKPERARTEYEAASGAASASRAEAQARLLALQQGEVPAAEIAQLRARLATNCTMCHAQ